MINHKNVVDTKTVNRKKYISYIIINNVNKVTL
ncbi:glycine cleavage system T protein [Bacteroides coprosuis DSM 18011]|uniref:Glycine cleavage system T protein n=1 Tax=Bacteroides coprosuis DSM 18011 TaxID=679937 RepID=F3ZS31_9BACE|nr:glycine cleavage system T protein [Bacteroides coprosuis DSM 18011]